MRSTRTLCVALAFLGSPGAALAVEVAAGVSLVPGRFVPGVQPDGNTVVFRAPLGLIVVDTGRHAEHTQRILDLANGSGLAVVAVVNSHWHLDHVGGNPRVRRAYPKVRVWASAALSDALIGFLARYGKQLEVAIAAEKDDAVRKGYQGELELIRAGPALGPDEVVTGTGPHTIGGRSVVLGLERTAVTAGDVWVLDPASGVLAAGDLVTLPAPLFDTACPRGWQAALAHLATLEFEVLVPGHGLPMGRQDLERYRAGFDHLLACAASTQTEQACVDGWFADLGALVPQGDRPLATSLLRYYLAEGLRAPPERTAALCGSAGSKPVPAASPR